MFKKISLTLAILLITGIIVSETTNFAVINTDRILGECKDGKRIQGILLALQDDWNAQIQDKQQEYEAAYEAYQNPPVMASDDYLTQKEQELADIEEEFYQLQEKIQSRANQKQNELLTPIINKLDSITVNLAAKHDFQAIFDVTITGFVYVDSTLDITDIVIEEMDKGVE
jgi:outer membrane protein